MELQGKQRSEECFLEINLQICYLEGVHMRYELCELLCAHRLYQMSLEFVQLFFGYLCRVLVLRAFQMLDVEIRQAFITFLQRFFGQLFDLI